MNAKKSTDNSRFLKCKSGHLAGRALGSRNRTTLLLESRLGDEAEALIRKIVKKGKDGNLRCVQMYMDRPVPAGKDRTGQFQLPPSLRLQDATSGMSSITAAVSEGELKPNEDETISRTLGQQANATVFIRTCGAESRSRSEAPQPMRTKSGSSKAIAKEQPGHELLDGGAGKRVRERGPQRGRPPGTSFARRSAGSSRSATQRVAEPLPRLSGSTMP